MDFSNLDLSKNQDLAREIVLRGVLEKFEDRREFEKFRNGIVKENKGVIFHNLYLIKAYNDLIEEGKIAENLDFVRLIQKRGVRTQSGVAPVTVLTKPWPCPGGCVYCPTDERMPKSYLASQPAAQRAFRQRFNPYTQVFVRLKALQMTGHEISKVELRIIGGTWSVYSRRYQTWFVGQCLLAMNEFGVQVKKCGDKMENVTRHSKLKSSYGVDEVNTVIVKPLGARGSFSDVVRVNETADVRCIGINVETRPDQVNEDEVRRLRKLGVTKVEMGVQTTFDSVQKLTRRGHTMENVRGATLLLKDAGFKIGYHMMPNLPGSDPKMDVEMFRELFSNQYYQPDYLKIYPCVVMPKTTLSLWYRQGKYKSYSDKILAEVLYEALKLIPEWCRVDRVARDIPSNEIESGFKVSNIRQILEKRFLDEGVRLRDIRVREVGVAKIKNEEFVLREYDASLGEELFLSYEDLKQDKLLALLRLRFLARPFIKALKGAAVVREVHVYGRQIAVGAGSKGEKQHSGYGKKLMKEAEKLAKEAGYKKIAVIAGIGTREYYRKFGYKLVGGYMLKDL